MRPIDDASFLTAEGRLTQVAAILAAGILRLHALTDSRSENPPTSARAGLEVSSETVLSVHRG